MVDTDADGKGNTLARKKLPVERAGYQALVSAIERLIEQGRQRAAGAVNTILVETYWQIGRYLVEFEQKGKARAEYGEELLKRLGKDLTAKYGRGFSWRNLFNMRKFYLTYPQRKLQTVSAISQKKQKGPIVSGLLPISQTPSATFSLSWSHYILLIGLDEEAKRSFYEIEAIKNSWSVRELERQINSLLYERLALSKDKPKVLALAKKGQVVTTPEDAIKDPYVLEFLGLKEQTVYTETKLEQALINHLQEFLLEMGKGFCFVARQKRITINNEHFYIDLVLYNRFLKCLVLIDLKLGRFSHADAGQMNFYLNYVKANEKLKDENDPIGLILCSDKDATFAEYVLGGLSNKIFASKYRLSLPKEEELIQEIEAEKRKLQRDFP